jgi:hypothetical protein
MAMLAHGVDELERNSSGLILLTDDKTLILCFPITFTIHLISFEAGSAQEPAPCAGGSECLAIPGEIRPWSAAPTICTLGNTHGLRRHAHARRAQEFVHDRSG